MNRPSYYPYRPRPARPHTRAFALQTILAGILLLLGTCTGSFLLIFPPHKLVEMLVNNGTNLNPTDQAALELMYHRLATIVVPITIPLGATLLVLAFFVRRASRPATVASCLITGLITLYSLLDVLRVPAIGGANAIVGLLMIGGFSALCIFTVLAQIRANAAPISAPAAGPYPPGGALPPIPPPPASYGYGYQIPPPQQPPGESKDRPGSGA